MTSCTDPDTFCVLAPRFLPLWQNKMRTIPDFAFPWLHPELPGSEGSSGLFLPARKAWPGWELLALPWGTALMSCLWFVGKAKTGPSSTD